MELDTLIGLFLAAIASAALAFAFALRKYKNRRSEKPAVEGDAVPLSDAARIAYRQAVAERLAVAGTAQYENTPDGAVAWFERSIREVVPVSEGADAGKVTRAELTRYLRWARTVQ